MKAILKYQCLPPTSWQNSWRRQRRRQIRRNDVTVTLCIKVFTYLFELISPYRSCGTHPLQQEWEKGREKGRQRVISSNFLAVVTAMDEREERRPRWEEAGEWQLNAAVDSADCRQRLNCEMCAVQRKQKEVEKANNFYYQLLQKALPCDEDTTTNDKPKGWYLVWCTLVHSADYC